MKIYKILFSVLFVIFSLIGKSQQIQHYSQYFLNDYAMNTAVAGLSPYYQARINNRYQWVGIVDAPKTFVLSLYGPDRKRDIGYGGYVFSDVTGPTSRTGVYGSYSYILTIKGTKKLSMSLSAGLLQYKIDGSKITLHDEGDPSLGEGIYSTYLPDANFSAYFKDINYFAGFSAYQLMNNKFKFSELDQLGINRVRTHFFLFGGYTFKINDDFNVEPSVVLKFMYPVPLQADISVRGFYKEKVWLGVSFRTMDAVAFMVGYEHDDQLLFGYSYDLSVSNIKPYNSGTHELMLGYRFSKIKRSDFHAKIDI